MADLNVEQLKSKAFVIRRDTIKMTTTGKSEHPTHNLSAANVMSGYCKDQQ